MSRLPSHQGAWVGLSRPMTEAEWLVSGDVQRMLAVATSTTFTVTSPRVGTQRQLRLFATACCRQVWDKLGAITRGTVEIAERYADGQATWHELEEASIAEAIASVHVHGWAGEPFLQDAFQAAIYTSRFFATSEDARVVPAVQAALLREVIGNPFGLQTFDPRWVAWNDGAAKRMAACSYLNNRFDQLAILADALEEAGCREATILSHLRDSEAVHVMGCWAIDLILGKR